MPDLFLPRSRPWHLTTAAEGGLKSAPASRLRGAVPHQLSSYASSSLARFVCSWRTMTGKPEVTSGAREACKKLCGQFGFARHIRPAQRAELNKPLASFVGLTEFH